MKNLALTTIFLIMVEGMILSTTINAGKQAYSTAKNFTAQIYNGGVMNCQNPFSGNCEIKSPFGG